MSARWDQADCRRVRWLRRPFLLAMLGATLPCQRPDDAALACGRCHVTVLAEWQASAHARAFADPLFQQALKTRVRPELCMPCHVPHSVLNRLGQMPRARAERPDEGITCVACHLGDAAIHGPSGAVTTAHPTVADPAFLRRGSVGLCIGCHDLRIADVLPLGREFLAAGLLDEGESCIGCHMERVRRASAQDPDTKADTSSLRNGRSHRLLGPSDPDFCASAFLLRIESTAAGARLVLGNGAGHGVPGLARLRTFAFRLQWQDQEGRALRDQGFSVSWQDRLAVEEERRMLLPVVRDAVALRIQVDHNFAGQKLATVLDRTLELP